MITRQLKKFSIFLLSLLLIFSTVNFASATDQQSYKGSVNEERLQEIKDRVSNYRNRTQVEKIDSTIDTTSNEQVKVLVEFMELPVVEQEVLAKEKGKVHAFNKAEAKGKMNKERVSFKENLNKNKISSKMGQSFEIIFNGIALEVKASDLPKLAEDANVRAIYKDNEVQAIPVTPKEETKPYMETSTSFIGVNELWNLGFEGEGMKVGVIDTGIDYNHPDLKDAYKGGYDFVDNDADPFEGKSGDVFIDSTHGTHVSGIVAGRGNYETGGTRGVAPKSDLYVYRVLGPEGGWNEWVIAGIEKAVEDDMDVINLSLGSNVNNPDYPTSRAVNNAMLAGVVTVVANGNSGEFGFLTVGSPATAALGISVGATYPPISETVYSGVSSLSEKENTLKWMMKWQPKELEDLFNDKGIIYMGFGTDEDFNGKDLSGKIALIKRGSTSFKDMNKRAEAAEAEAVIVFNGDGINDHINHPFPQEGNLPMFDMRGDEGRDLADKLRFEFESATYKLTNSHEDVYPGDELAGFSSKGPVVSTWDIKPDVSAPGGYIRSAVPSVDGVDYSKAYEHYSGTSMAAPHIAGLALLILENRPDFSVFDVKTALMNTSKMIQPLEGGRYSVLELGAGRVQAHSTVETPVLAQIHDITSYTTNPFGDELKEEVNHIMGSANFGPLKLEDTVTKPITLKDISNTDTTYTVSYDFRFFDSLGNESENPQVADMFKSMNVIEEVVNQSGTVSSELNGVTLTLSDSEVSVPAGGTVNLDLSLFTAQIANDGIYEGYVYLTPTDSTKPAIQIPFIGYNNPNLINPITHFERSPVFLSLNNDGIDESTTFEFGFLDDMDVVGIYMMDVDWNVAGMITEFDGKKLSEGNHTFEWDGMYTDWNTGEFTSVPSNEYEIWIEATDKFGNFYYRATILIVSNEKTDILIDQIATHDTEENYIYTTKNEVSGYLSSKIAELSRDRMYHVSLSYYWDLLDLEYELYDLDGKILSSGEVDLKNEEEVEFTIADVLPNGASRLVLRASDNTGNVNEIDYLVNYDQPTGAQINMVEEIEVGQELVVTLQGNQVENLKAAEYTFSYPSSVFTLNQVKPNSQFNAQLVKYDVLGVTKDSMGMEITTIKVKALADLKGKKNKKGKKEAAEINGNIPMVDLLFQSSKDGADIGDYSFKVTEANYISKKSGKVNLLPAENKTELYTQPGTFYGQIKPEAFLDQEGNPRKDILYGRIKAEVEIYDSEEGYGSGSSFLVSDHGYRIPLNYSFEQDGSFEITGLNPKKKYDLVFNYDGHFSGVVRGVQAATSKDGNLMSHAVEVEFGKLIAGDVENEHPLQQYIDISDVSKIARQLGRKETKSNDVDYRNHDINSDGEINDKDLQLSLKNYGLHNIQQEGVDVPPPNHYEDPFGPQLVFVTDTTEINKGDIIPVHVKIDKVDEYRTQKIYAVQYAFTYDPEKFELITQDGKASTIGEVFTSDNNNVIEIKNSAEGNRVEFAATYRADANEDLIESGILATYYLKALTDTGSSTLGWDVSRSKILLEQIYSSNGDIFTANFKATDLEMVIGGN